MVVKNLFFFQLDKLYLSISRTNNLNQSFSLRIPLLFDNKGNNWMKFKNQGCDICKYS